MHPQLYWEFSSPLTLNVILRYLWLTVLSMMSLSTTTCSQPDPPTILHPAITSDLTSLMPSKDARQSPCGMWFSKARSDKNSRALGLSRCFISVCRPPIARRVAGGVTAGIQELKRFLGSDSTIAKHFFPPHQCALAHPIYACVMKTALVWVSDSTDRKRKVGK